VKKVVLLIFVVLVIAVIVSLNQSKELTKDENSEQLVKKEDQTAVANDYSPSGAIARAKALLEEKSFRDEAYQLFGLNLWLRQEDEYLQFKGRIFVNSQLASAFQNAKKEDVGVFLDNKFEVETGYVNISTDATDEKIIEFLSSSVAVAKAKWMELESLRKEASQYGIYIWSRDVERYKQMRTRLSSNKDLASALRAAAREEVMVYFDKEFLVTKGYVNINVDATDEEIIKFLLGK